MIMVRGYFPFLSGVSARQYLDRFSTFTLVIIVTSLEGDKKDPLT